MAASSSQDFLFEVALRRLQEELSGGLGAAELADPGMLEGHPRGDFGELVAAGVAGLWTAEVDTGTAVVRILVL